jgi:hypothetical protein
MEGKTMYPYLYPDSLTYLIVKICVLALVLLLYFAITSAPVV